MPPSSPGFGFGPLEGRGGEAGSSVRKRQGEPQGLGVVLQELLDTRPWGAGVLLGELARRWDVVVGEPLARESVPTLLQDGMLVVRASSAAWGAQLTFLADRLRDRANLALGRPAVERVKVFVDPRAGGGDRRAAGLPEGPDTLSG